jgi:putative FmdB family regulatory protein
MPLFEYQCSECGYRFEALVVGTRAPEKCPRCESEALEKQFSTFGLGGSTHGTPRGSSCGTSSGG